MPIFEHEGKKIYFCHIPKTAGTAIYFAFAESGWTMRNITERSQPHAASEILKKRYSIKSIGKTGSAFGYPHSLQHAPHLIWKTWGPFDESFAIIRNPVDRFFSTVRYRYQHLIDGAIPFDRYLHKIIDDIHCKPWRIFTSYDGHFIPQHLFLGGDTILFHYNQNWQEKIVERYGLEKEALRRENVSKVENGDHLTYKTLNKLVKVYKKDLRLYHALKKTKGLI